MIKKNDELVVDIISQGYSGEGVAKVEEYPIFIKGGIQGEKVKIKITKANKNYAYGRVLEILESSEGRVIPRCEYYKLCGGCSLQHMDYETQINFKWDRVKDCIKRLGKLDDSLVEKPIGMNEFPYRYRNKVQLPVGMVNGEVVIGFYAERSHNIIDIETCLIQDEVADRVRRITKRWIEENAISVYTVDGKVNKKGLIRHVMIRKGFKTNEVMVVLVSTDENIPKIEEYKKALIKEIDGLASVVININNKDTNVILGEKCITIYGKDSIQDYIGNLKFNISPLAFFQVNPIQVEALYNKALEFADLKGDEIVFDAYCGTGSITLFLSQKAKKVYGVEIIAPAIENAKVNAKINNINNVEFFVGKSEEEIPKLIEKGVKADVIVVDPPRKGCDEALLNAIAESKVEKIVYVSCDPSTLGRDLKILTDLGYQTLKVQPVDMFPQTPHVETVVLLSQRKADDYVEVELELDELDVTSAETKATYKEIQEYVLKEHGLKVSNLYISQVKRKCGIEVGENYNLPKSEDSRQPQRPEEKEKAIRDALEHFGMA